MSKDKKGKQGELTPYQNMVQNKLKTGMGSLFQGVEMGPFGPYIGRRLEKFSDNKDIKKRILKAKGASPGRIKAEFGKEMADGGVVDLTTEMEVNE